MLLVYGLADEHKPMHTLRVHIGILLMQNNLEIPCATELRRATVSVEFFLGWGSDVWIRLYGHSSSRNSLPSMFGKFRQCVYGLIFFEFPLLNLIQVITELCVLCETAISKNI